MRRQVSAEALGCGLEVETQGGEVAGDWRVLEQLVAKKLRFHVAEAGAVEALGSW